jgi:hypothetical protein
MRGKMQIGVADASSTWAHRIIAQSEPVESVAVLQSAANGCVSSVTFRR